MLALETSRPLLTEGLHTICSLSVTQQGLLIDHTSCRAAYQHGCCMLPVSHMLLLLLLPLQLLLHRIATGWFAVAAPPAAPPTPPGWQGMWAAPMAPCLCTALTDPAACKQICSVRVAAHRAKASVCTASKCRQKTQPAKKGMQRQRTLGSCPPSNSTGPQEPLLCRC